MTCSQHQNIFNTPGFHALLCFGAGTSMLRKIIIMTLWLFSVLNNLSITIMSSGSIFNIWTHFMLSWLLLPTANWRDNLSLTLFHTQIDFFRVALLVDRNQFVRDLYGKYNIEYWKPNWRNGKSASREEKAKTTSSYNVKKTAKWALQLTSVGFFLCWKLSWSYTKANARRKKTSQIT